MTVFPMKIAEKAKKDLIMQTKGRYCQIITFSVMAHLRILSTLGILKRSKSRGSLSATALLFATLILRSASKTLEFEKAAFNLLLL